VGCGASKLSWRSIRSRLRGESSTCAGRLDGVAAGTVLRRGRWVGHGSVLGGRHDRDRSLGDVDNLHGGGLGWDLLLLRDVVGRSVGRLVTTVAGSRLLSRRLGLLATVVGAGWHCGHGRNNGDVGSRGGGLGDGVGYDSWAALVADVDRGDRVGLALVADGLGDGLGLGGDTSLARVNIGGGNNLDRRASWGRRVVLTGHAGDGRRVRSAVDGSRAGKGTVDRGRA
jgi:hypothetical protein